ncbi:hypothetical protein BKA66DRAFT_564240 [Pyrenochaeta sp. MPI-SDFR-AT-0127]|nr:hypothetical protein BKA66DRAFT_564240 [Pyrenochaeta sp. MPI-SDFR-AT-0127]
MLLCTSDAYTETQDLLVILVSTFQSFPASLRLPSIRGIVWNKVYDALTESTPPPRPTSSVQRTPWLHSTGSIVNSSERRIQVDKVLKEELGPMYVDVPDFSEAFFGQVAGLGPAAQAVFDKSAGLSWLGPLIAQFSDFAEEHKPISEARRRALAQPHQPDSIKTSFFVQDSTASRKLDIGFVDDPSAGEFDQLGGIASAQFDIHKDRLQFISTLGFNPTIIIIKRFVIANVIRRISSVVGRQYLERDEEGEVLCKAIEKPVVRVARYYHHETGRIGDRDDDIRGNVRKGLDITKATNYRPESSMAPPSIAGRHISRCTDTPLPPSKRTYSSSLTKGERATTNRVRRRVLVRDYRKPIYKASSLTSLLAALEGCIKGYESLYTYTGILQGDISLNNLIPAFLIDLDLAIKVGREKSSGARRKTGTRAL